MESTPGRRKKVGRTALDEWKKFVTGYNSENSEFWCSVARKRDSWRRILREASAHFGFEPITN